MSFEIIGLPNTWFLASEASDRDVLTRVLNKSYDKSRFRFGIIGSQRVKNQENLCSDFDISVDKPFVLFLVLGPEHKFKHFHKTDGYFRDFSVDSKTLEESFDSDISEKYVGDLLFADQNDFSIELVKDGYKLSPEICSRVLGTVGFKGFKDKHQVHERQVELTSFTSFLRSSAPKFLEIVIEKTFLSDKFVDFDSLFHIKREELKKVKLLATVIKEHGLAVYYTSKCRFLQSEEADVLIEINEDGTLKGENMEDGVVALKDFHLTFIYRDLLI